MEQAREPKEWALSDIFAGEDVQLKLKVMHAVDKSLDQITVSSICEKAGISRQTFYRHFDSKYSLHWWWPMHVHRFYLAEVGRTLSWQTGYARHLELLGLERDYFKIATQYTASFSPTRGIMPHFRKCTLLETLQDYQGVEVGDDLMFCVENWVRTETDVLTEWFRLDSTPDPAEAAHRLVAIMPRALFDATNVPRCQQ